MTVPGRQHQSRPSIGRYRSVDIHHNGPAEKCIPFPQGPSLLDSTANFRRRERERRPTSAPLTRTAIYPPRAQALDQRSCQARQHRVQTQRREQRAPCTDRYRAEPTMIRDPRETHPTRRWLPHTGANFEPGAGTPCLATAAVHRRAGSQRTPTASGTAP